MRRWGAGALGRRALLTLAGTLGCTAQPTLPSPTLDHWKVNAARSIESSQHLPRGSVSVDTFTQRYYNVDSTAPAKLEECTIGAQCRIEYDYSRAEGRPRLHIQLDDAGVQASGWFQGRYSEARMHETALAAWKYMPSRLPIVSVEIGLVEGGEHEITYPFDPAELDGRRPRQGLATFDAIDSALNQASVVIEGSFDSIGVEKILVDDVQAARVSYCVVRPQHAWRGLPGRTIRVNWAPERHGLVPCWTCRGSAPGPVRDSLYLVDLGIPDLAGVFPVIRAVTGPALAAERLRIAVPPGHDRGIGRACDEG